MGFHSPVKQIKIYPDGGTVDALVLGTNDFGRESSSLSWGTKITLCFCVF